MNIKVTVPVEITVTVCAEVENEHEVTRILRNNPDMIRRAVEQIRTDTRYTPTIGYNDDESNSVGFGDVQCIYSHSSDRMLIELEGMNIEIR